jgi:hypothetical protein
VEGSAIVFVFKLCGAPAGDVFVERLIVEKTNPADEAGTMCGYESPSDGSSVLTKSWRYGSMPPGVDRCWPLTEGTYSVTAIGSGAGWTKFSLAKKWFGGGFSRTILDGACKA